MSEIGHNSTAASDDQLRLFIERIERQQSEIKDQQADVRETFAEAKAQGYDAKMMRQIIALRKMERADRQEMEAILEVYKAALGMD